MEPTNGGKAKLIVIAVIVVIAVAVFMWLRGTQPVESPSASIDSESLSEIQNSVTSVDTGDLDKEFDSINKDLNTL